MWPLIRDFFMTKTAAVRAFGVVFSLVGVAVASGMLPEWMPKELAWVMAVIGGGTSQTAAPKPKPEG